MTENTPPKAEATLRPPKVIQTQATPETDVSTPWKASPLVDENVTFSETSCSSTTLSHEDGATLPPKLALNSSNRALFQDSPVARSSEQELAVYPPCCTTLPERRVERYPPRRTERHASSRQLRSRRLSQTSSFYSSDEDEQPRRRSTTRRRRRSSKEDHSFRNQVLRFSRTRSFQWILTIMGLTSVSMTFLAGHSLMQNDLEHPQRIEVLFRQLEGEADEEEEVESETTPVTAADHRFAGLRGNMLHDVVIDMEKKTPSRLKPSNEDPKQSKHHHHHHGVGSKSHSNGHKIAIKIQGGVAVPAKKLHGVKPLAEPQDGRFYPDAPVAVEESLRRVVALEGSPEATQYQLDVYPSPFTDNTQLYSLLDSSDERLHTMELREPLDDGECVPMQEWQTTFHPSCNAMHEMDMASMGQKNGDFFSLFGTKGYWRNAWRVDAVSGLPQTGEVDTIVLKTLK